MGCTATAWTNERRHVLTDASVGGIVTLFSPTHLLSKDYQSRFVVVVLVVVCVSQTPRCVCVFKCGSIGLKETFKSISYTRRLSVKVCRVGETPRVTAITATSHLQIYEDIGLACPS